MKSFVRIATVFLPTMAIIPSCRTSMYPLVSKFTTWSDENGFISINCQFSHEGGNGKVLVGDKQESFIWEFEGDNYIDKYWPDVLAYIPSLDMDFHFDISEIKGENSKLFTVKNNVANIEIKYDSTAKKFGWEKATVKKTTFDDSNLDFKNYLSSKITCESLGLSFSNTVEAQKSSEGLRNELSGNYIGLCLFLLDDCKFTMRMKDLTSSGTYTTSKTQVLFQFETDSIFNLGSSSIFFELASLD